MSTLLPVTRLESDDADSSGREERAGTRKKGEPRKELEEKKDRSTCCAVGISGERMNQEEFQEVVRLLEPDASSRAVCVVNSQQKQASTQPLLYAGDILEITQVLDPKFYTRLHF